MENFLKQAIATLEGLDLCEGFTATDKEQALEYYRTLLAQEQVKNNLGEQHWKTTGTTGYYVWNPNLSYARDGQPFFPFGQPAPQGWGTVQC